MDCSLQKGACISASALLPKLNSEIWRANRASLAFGVLRCASIPAAFSNLEPRFRSDLIGIVKVHHRAKSKALKPLACLSKIVVFPAFVLKLDSFGNQSHTRDWALLVGFGGASVIRSARGPRDMLRLISGFSR